MPCYHPLPARGLHKRFPEALGALLSRDVPNLSPSAIARLKSEWKTDYAHPEASITVAMGCKILTANAQAGRAGQLNLG